MSKRITRLVLVVTVLLQCGVMLYWAGRKSSFYNDEFYTFEYAQNVANNLIPFEYMTYSDFWKSEEWLSVKYLKTRFTVEEGESVFDIPFKDSFKRFFERRNYMWILNAIESVLGDRVSPKWICIGMNILILALFQFLLYYLLAGLLRLTRRNALLAVAMWGFCPYILGFAVFCRFYALALFLFLIILVLHRLMWDCDSVWKNLLMELLAAFLLYLAYKNSELVAVACGALIVFFTIGLVIRKRYAQSLYYSLPFMIGGLVVIQKTSKLLDAFLHPALYANRSGKLLHAFTKHSDKLLNSSWSDKLNNMWSMIWEFGDSVSGSFWLFVLEVVLLVVLFFLVRKRISRKVDGFIVILAGVALVFWVFCALYGLMYTRYHSLLFLLVFIVAWWVFDRLARSDPSRKFVREFVIGLVALGAILPFFRRNVEYVYEDFKPIAETISEYKDTKCLLVCSKRFLAPYSCVNYLDESNSVYAIFKKFSEIDSLPELPYEFLYWTEHNAPDQHFTRLLHWEGYSIMNLFETTNFDIYLCKKPHFDDLEE